MVLLTPFLAGEGTYRDRHGTLVGNAVDAAGVSAGKYRADETRAADGEVVWSWRRDPGATLAASLPLATGARKAASPGRARISRKPLRGESRDVSAVPVKPVCVLLQFLHTVLRAQSAPGFPCALSFGGANGLASPGQIRAAGLRTAVL